MSSEETNNQTEAMTPADLGDSILHAVDQALPNIDLNPHQEAWFLGMAWTLALVSIVSSVTMGWAIESVQVVIWGIAGAVLFAGGAPWVLNLLSRE